MLKQGLFQRFYASVQSHPDKPALVIGKTSYTYRELFQKVNLIAQNLAESIDENEQWIGFLSDKSVEAYSSILGILQVGRGYVPLNPKFPGERLRAMIIDAGIKTILVAPQSNTEALLLKIFENFAGQKPKIIMLKPLINGFKISGILYQNIDQSLNTELISSFINEDSPAYLLFTSGSTGRPKGIGIHQGAAAVYLDHVINHYQFSQEDRISQFFELTFDPSVHDLFCTWSVGASLHVVADADMWAPARFIQTHQLTVWYSTPSVITTMHKMHMLNPGSFPTIKWSLFSGEALGVNAVKIWEKAASFSLIENLYGPTEATVNITKYRWSDTTENESEGGIVPIGTTWSSQLMKVIDENKNEVAFGELGELCFSGPQLAKGYWNSPEKTTAQFIVMDGKTWYRTGDLVKWSSLGNLIFKGRIDSQVKVRGFRMELQEIEHYLNLFFKVPAVAVSWPIGSAVADRIYAMVETNHKINEAEAREYCAKYLPAYFLPEKILTLGEFPLNSSGKIDRKTLAKLVEEYVNVNI